MQSNLYQHDRNLPFHVAIIMDGNGRWAERQGKPRAFGHEMGVGAISRAIAAAPSVGITVLSMFGFSSNNWKRPKAEVDNLMNLVLHYLQTELDHFIQNDIRVVFLGRRDRLSDALVQEMEKAEDLTSDCRTLTVRIAIDYSARDELLSVATKSNCSDRDSISRFLSGYDEPTDVDLMIRTGGEQRISDFLLWESAYAELLFLDVSWPDFDGPTLIKAVGDFQTRERTFGSLPNSSKLRAKEIEFT